MFADSKKGITIRQKHNRINCCTKYMCTQPMPILSMFYYCYMYPQTTKNSPNLKKPAHHHAPKQQQRTKTNWSISTTIRAQSAVTHGSHANNRLQKKSQDDARHHGNQVSHQQQGSSSGQQERPKTALHPPRYHLAGGGPTERRARFEDFPVDDSKVREVLILLSRHYNNSILCNALIRISDFSTQKYNEDANQFDKQN